MTLPALSPEAATEPLSAADSLAVVTQTAVISQFEVLMGDIKEARANAATVAFDLTDKKGIAAAKSYVFGLRRFNGRIDEAHKEAKQEILERGRKIDQVKNVLREQVAALIQPHQDALDVIAKAEAVRLAKHRERIAMIKDAARVPFGSTSQQINKIHREIAELDLSGMEEFEAETKAAWADTIQTLTTAHAKAQEAEEREAELTQLREEARLQAERDAEAKRIKDAEDAAAEVARKAQEAADAAALAVIEEAEQRAAAAQAEAAAAQAQAAAANRRALDAEAVADALQSEALLAIKPADIPTVATPTRVDAELALQQELHSALAGRTRAEVVAALISGTLHPAVKIDWSTIAGVQG